MNQYKYDFAIYGGGPTGIFLAYFLGLNNKKIILIEQDTDLGGCWNSKWINEQYFSEHSPRVLKYDYGTTFFNILEHHKFDLNKELVNTYGTIFETTFKLAHYLLANLNFRDIVLLIKSYVINDYYGITITQWCKKNKISLSGKKALSLLSVALANSPDKLLISEIFKSGTIANFKQFKNPKKWINIMENELLKLNVKIIKKYKVIKLKEHDNEIHTSIIQQIYNLDDIKEIHAQNHILTLPPVAFYNLLHNSDYKVQNNWMELENLKKWMLESYYASIGFQLHFKDKIEFKKEWCWTCKNDYQLIVLPTSQYINKFSKDPEIKTVWSCTVVDTDNLIVKRNKTINELNLNIILDDCLEILNVNPDKITFYPGLHKQFGKYMSKDTAFSLGQYGTIPYKGNKINNLFTVGPHNDEGLTVINKAVDSAYKFSKKQGFKLPQYTIPQNTNMTFKLIILFIIIYLIWSM